MVNCLYRAEIFRTAPDRLLRFGATIRNRQSWGMASIDRARSSHPGVSAPGRRRGKGRGGRPGGRTGRRPPDHPKPPPPARSPAEVDDGSGASGHTEGLLADRGVPPQLLTRLMLAVPFCSLQPEYALTPRARREGSGQHGGHRKDIVHAAHSVQCEQSRCTEIAAVGEIEEHR